MTVYISSTTPVQVFSLSHSTTLPLGARKRSSLFLSCFFLISLISFSDLIFCLWFSFEKVFVSFQFFFYLKSRRAKFPSVSFIQLKVVHLFTVKRFKKKTDHPSIWSFVWTFRIKISIISPWSLNLFDLWLLYLWF
jgi:hypothetical protein